MGSSGNVQRAYERMMELWPQVFEEEGEGDAVQGS